MNAPARPRDEMLQLNSQLETRAEQFAMALPSHISVEKFQRTVITAVQADPILLTADRQTLLLACMKAAQDGLLPDKREAALVIFKSRKKDAQGRWDDYLQVQYMPMAYGLRKKILQSGEVSDITTGVVYRQEVEAGRFYYEEGTERLLRYKPDLLGGPYGDDDIALAYSVATMKDGSRSFEIMRRWEIDRVREMSQTGATRDKKGDARQPSGPWVDWFPEQCRKTVLRRHSKSLPMSGDIIDVEASDEIAAASAARLLSAPAAPPQPSLEPPPQRRAMPYEPVADPVGSRINVEAKPLPVQQAGPADDHDAARQVAAADPSFDGIRHDPADNAGDDDDDAGDPATQADPAPEYDDGAFDLLQGRINNASSVASLARVIGDIEGHPALKPEWRETLLKNAAVKQAELKGGAK